MADCIWFIPGHTGDDFAKDLGIEFSKGNKGKIHKLHTF